MKVQCSCGAKYSFDVTPALAENPLQLVCQTCGTDISSFVNELVRQELAATAPAPLPPEAPVISAPEAPAAAGRLRVKVGTHAAPSTAAPASAPVAAAQPGEWPLCLKHPPHRGVDRCRVCQKPICPECMALFGYVCSPYCKAQASAHGIAIPVFEGQRDVIKARQWRRISWAAGGIAAILLALCAVGIWIVFVGSVPKPYFSVRYEERARSGKSVFCGNDQIVFLHGPTLARHDTKQKKAVWSRELVTKSEVAAQHTRAGEDKPTEDDLEDYFAWATGDLKLVVKGQNIWIARAGKLTRYDWDTGEPKQEIPLTGDGEALLYDDEVLLVSEKPGNQAVTHLSLVTGEKRVEAVGETGAKKISAAAAPLAAKPAKRPGTAAAPLPVPGTGTGAPLDPEEVAAYVQRLSYPARVALPATLANAWQQDRLQAELDEQDGKTAAPAKVPSAPTEIFSLVPTKEGCLQFSARLLERKIVVRTVMKAKPAKSALSGDVRATDTGAIANEILNEIQRDRGGDTINEDQSRYGVTVRRADGKNTSAWSGEVVGPPGLIPLQTVNVLTAGNTLVVLNKENKKLWEQTLTFSVPTDSFAYETGEASGAGPCVERDGTLYVADQGVLTAFDLANGNARWRLPSVGISGLFFDDEGQLYVNTTTAGPESIKYSNQIDVTSKIDPVVLKIDPASGKTLWKSQPGGSLSAVSGHFLYVVISEEGDFDEKGNVVGIDTGLERSAFLRIKRLNAKSGKEMWSHFQPRCPLDVQFHQNHIQLVFRKEVQALTYYDF